MPRKNFDVVRDTFANDSGLPFGRILTRDHVLGVLEDEGHKYRQRVFCPLVTLWAWLSQSLSQDKSLNEAVSRIVAFRVTSGLPACSASSASYSDARVRFPLPVLSRLAKDMKCFSRMEQLFRCPILLKINWSFLRSKPLLQDLGFRSCEQSP